jgi:hypothetical protein
VREPAPPYRNEGPHALWHVSGDASLHRFEPHVAATAARPEPLVWAVDTRHLPLYWFPRDCPRACFWSRPGSAAADLALLRGSPQVHAIEEAWLDRVRSARVVAYRLPEATFEHGGDGFWISRNAVDTLELVELGDLVARHAQSGIELRAVESLWPLWNAVVASTLEFSGIRLHNAAPMLTP